jgi:hypothetical protein
LGTWALAGSSGGRYCQNRNENAKAAPSIQISRRCPNCQIRLLAHLLFDSGRDSTFQTPNPHHRHTTSHFPFLFYLSGT